MKKRKGYSPRQIAARKRNFTKRRLSATLQTLLNLTTSPTLNVNDRSNVALAAGKIKAILRGWDDGYVARRSDKEIEIIAKSSY